MADQSTSDYLQQIINGLSTGAQGINGINTNNSANAIMQSAYAAVIKNLQNGLDAYSNLSPAQYKAIQAQQLGPSQLGSIQDDTTAKHDQEAAIAAEQDKINHGGLSLQDMQAINQLQQSLGQNNAARQNSTANQYAARGQLGSGAQLTMDLQGNQNASQNAGNAGANAAAQAQQQLSQALLAKGQMSSNLSNQEYQRKAATANANDSIARANAAAQTDASKYNNGLQGQTYQDTLSKFKAENDLTGKLDTAILGSGTQNSNTTLANGNVVNQGISGFGAGLSKVFGSSGTGGSGSGYTPSPGDTQDAPGTQGTQDFNKNLQPDPNDTPAPTVGEDIPEDFGGDW